KARVRPRLDPLERRDCPTVDVVQSGTFLYITGDAADDWVAVADKQSRMIEVETVRGTETFDGIKFIVGNLGEGNDTFEFHQAAGQTESLNLRLDLAAGDDQFLYASPPGEVNPPEPERPATYSFDVHSGTGNDVMIVAPEFIPGLDLNLRFDLGTGSDQFEASYKRNPATPIGAFMPCYSLDVESGDGNDRVTVTIGDEGIGEPLPLEDMSAGVHDFGGDDVGIIIICDVAVTGGLTETLDLGAGANSASLRLDDVTVGGQLKQSVTAGDGGNEVGIIIIGGHIGAASQKVNVGAGDDEVGIIINNGVVGSLLQSVNTGGGGDEVGFVIVGGRVEGAAQKVNVGDGEDTVGFIIDGGIVGSLSQSVDA